jgi:hypothetical protein
MTEMQEESILEQLEVAWAHLGVASGDLDMPDVIAHADIAFKWESFKNELVELISTGDYGRLPIEVVDLPKDSLNVRPLVRMTPEDRLIYDAAIFAAANDIESVIPRGVYSYRWWKAQKRLLGGSMWVKMQSAARYLHKKQPGLLLARTDVTAFYENIDAGILIGDIEALAAPSWATEVLGTFLSSFNEKPGIWGIPQGSDASGLLANLYLVELDLEIVRRGFRHFRYSDDVYIFGEDWIALREILLEATKILRYRHLTLAGAKTKIYPSREIDKVFEDGEKDAIGYGVRNLTVESIEDLHNLFDRTTDQETLNERDLKFCLTKLGDIYDAHAAAWVVANLDNLPHITREALNYLGKFPWIVEHTGKAVVESLVNSKLMMYPYAEQHLLVWMINNEAYRRDALGAAWTLLLDKNKASFVREFAARYIGLASRRGNALRLKPEFHREAQAGVRRALLIACYESGQCTDRWLDEVWQSSPGLRRTVEYLKAKPQEIPRPIVDRSFWNAFGERS